MVVLLAVDVALDGVEGTPLSCDAEAEEAVPTEGEMWIEGTENGGLSCVRGLEPGHHWWVQERCQAGML